MTLAPLIAFLLATVLPLDDPPADPPEPADDAQSIQNMLNEALRATGEPIPAEAEQAAEPKGEVLDRLYEELAAAETPAQANVTANQIETLWESSGSATVDLLMERASQAMAAEDPALAARHLDDALRFAPDHAQGWVRRAQLFALNDEYGEAVTALERALTADPKHYLALMALARTLDNMDAPQGAYEAYGEALAVHPFLEEATEERRRLAPLVEGRDL